MSELSTCLNPSFYFGISTFTDTYENKELNHAYEDSLLKASQNQPANKIEHEKIIPSPKDGENKSFPSASTNVSLK